MGGHFGLITPIDCAIFFLDCSGDGWMPTACLHGMIIFIALSKLIFIPTLSLGTAEQLFFVDNTNQGGGAAVVGARGATTGAVGSADGGGGGRGGASRERRVHASGGG